MIEIELIFDKIVKELKHSYKLSAYDEINKINNIFRIDKKIIIRLLSTGDTARIIINENDFWKIKRVINAKDFLKID